MTKENFLSPFKKIRFKASLFVLFLLILTTAAFSVISLRIMNRHLLGEVIKRAESICQSTASTAGYNLISQDLLGLDNIVFRVKSSNPDIEYMAILDLERKILVHSDINRTGETFLPASGNAIKKSEDGTTTIESGNLGAGVFEAESPIVFMEKPLGSVVLGINKSVLLEAQREARKELTGIVAFLLLGGVGGSLLLSSFLTKPIQQLSAGVAELKQGKRSQPLRIYSRDELGKLTESFNEMTALITSQRQSLGKYAQDLEEAYVATVRVLAAAIDARDTYTLGHSTRVAQLSVAIGRDLGLSPQELEELEIACLFHDVGKIKIPDCILQKKGALDASEQREMRRHPEYGVEILSKASSLVRYLPAVRHHHEWYDGTGYPERLGGDKIPMAAAIISVADAYDAMTSDRPYRNALTERQALAKIGELAGRQFAPDVAERFVRLMEKKAAEIELRAK